MGHRVRCVPQDLHHVRSALYRGCLGARRLAAGVCMRACIHTRGVCPPALTGMAPSLACPALHACMHGRVAAGASWLSCWTVSRCSPARATSTSSTSCSAC